MATTEAATGTDHTLGFQSQDQEVTVDSLPVSGDVPAWLTGALVRVTPALLEVGGRRLDHWFDGLAMLNRFGFADGRVSYGSRFLESRAYEDAREGRVERGGFATDPCRSIFKRVQSDLLAGRSPTTPNVNLARIGERVHRDDRDAAADRVRPESLDTLGQPPTGADELTGRSRPRHPHHDRERNELVNYTPASRRVSEYRV